MRDVVERVFAKEAWEVLLALVETDGNLHVELAIVNPIKNNHAYAALLLDFLGHLDGVVGVRSQDVPLSQGRVLKIVWEWKCQARTDVRKKR